MHQEPPDSSPDHKPPDGPPASAAERCPTSLEHNVTPALNGLAVEEMLNADLKKQEPVVEKPSESVTRPFLEPGDLVYDRRQSNCYRCGLVHCKGIKFGPCILESNSFPGKKKDQICPLCPILVQPGDVITAIKRGPHAGSYAHLKCAFMWYQSNPITDEVHFTCCEPDAGFAASIKAQLPEQPP